MFEILFYKSWVRSVLGTSTSVLGTIASVLLYLGQLLLYLGRLLLYLGRFPAGWCSEVHGRLMTI